MANIHERFSWQDVSGVFGLLAFLQDAKACEDRLAEMHDAAKALSAAEVSAGEAKKAAEDAVANAGRLIDEAAAVRSVAEKQRAAALESQARADAKWREFNDFAKDVGVRESAMVAAKAVADAASAALDAREKKLAEAEAAAAALKAEYEGKLAKLSRLIEQ